MKQNAKNRNCTVCGKPMTGASKYTSNRHKECALVETKAKKVFNQSDQQNRNDYNKAILNLASALVSTSRNKEDMKDLHATCESIALMKKKIVKHLSDLIPAEFKTAHIVEKPLEHLIEDSLFIHRLKQLATATGYSTPADMLQISKKEWSKAVNKKHLPKEWEQILRNIGISPHWVKTGNGNIEPERKKVV